MTRTPPPEYPPPPVFTPPPGGVPDPAESVAVQTVLSALSPTGLSESIPTASLEQETQQVLGASKRMFSPDETTEMAGPLRKLKIGLFKDVEPGCSTPTPGQDYHTPYSSSDSEGEGSHKDDMARSTCRQLLAKANACARIISGVAGGFTSKLNKADLASINAQLTNILEVVSHLGLMAEESRVEIKAARTTFKILKEGRARDADRATRAEAEAERAREAAAAAATSAAAAAAAEAAAAAVATNAAAGANHNRTYADKLRDRPSGPALAFYPAEGNNDLKTAEDTKALLKKSVAPATLGINIQAVRKVGKAGVVVQTRTKEDAQRLRQAAPISLRVAEANKRNPLVALRNVEGDPELADVLPAIQEQNFAGDAKWTTEAIASNCRLAFKKGRRGGSRTTLVLACTPELRKALLDKGRVFVGWEMVTVEDYCVAPCCSKCHLYGHTVARCPAPNATCGRCGEVGHDKEECKSAEAICATCKKFGHQGARSHLTASRECPARIHAEKRMMETTNYV